MREHYQVNEIFHTVQGEGVLAGSPSTFIRLQGCTVGCPWCDTKYTWLKGGTRMTVKEIVNQVRHPHVVITGGEPTMYNLDGLIYGLRAKQSRRFIQLETSGQNELKGIFYPDWITWSPKENLQWDAPEEIWAAASEVKWVVDETLERPLVDSWWQRYEAFPATPYFVLMPEGCPPRPEMVEKALQWLHDRPQWKFGDRLQCRIGVK